MAISIVWFFPVSVSSSFLNECHVLSLFFEIFPSFPGLVCVPVCIFVCIYVCIVYVCVWERDQCFLWRDDELAQWVMNCGGTWWIQCSAKVCAPANLEETLVISRWAQGIVCVPHPHVSHIHWNIHTHATISRHFFNAVCVQHPVYTD